MDQWETAGQRLGREFAFGSRRGPNPAFDECHQRGRSLLLPPKTPSEVLAESWRASSRTMPATIEVPTAEDIWNAASLKGRFPIAYADAFAAALAQKYNCPLVTGDPELRLVDQLELDWIGGRDVPRA